MASHRTETCWYEYPALRTKEESAFLSVLCLQSRLLRGRYEGWAVRVAYRSRWVGRAFRRGNNRNPSSFVAL